MDQFFLQSPLQPPGEFCGARSASLGLSGVQKVMAAGDPRCIIGRMDDKQLLAVRRFDSPVHRF